MNRNESDETNFNYWGLSLENASREAEKVCRMVVTGEIDFRYAAKRLSALSRSVRKSNGSSVRFVPRAEDEFQERSWLVINRGFILRKQT